MKKSRLIRFFKKLHKWPAIVIAFIAILFAASGIIMNHRSAFSGVDVPRKLLPKNYTYKNWNMSAVRGSISLGDSLLVYGNIGVWKCDPDFRLFTDFNTGFPNGIDNRKIYKIDVLNNQLFAGTHIGLYKRQLKNGAWQKVELPVKNERIADLEIKNDTLLVLTRYYLLKTTDGNLYEKIQLPESVYYVRETGLFDTFWQLHSGELFGLTGKLLVDLLGIITIVLSVTGLLHFFFPKIIKRRKKKDRAFKGVVATKRTNLRWHNVLGYVFALFLLINTFAGIHLRPPLLIAIANSRVGIIPGTHLDSPNPWFDKLRRVMWDDVNRRYIFSTSEGFFFADESLSKKFRPAIIQPPVSIMGCNVMEPLNSKMLLVGSFSGMFVWNTETGQVSDFFSGQAYQAPERMVRPIAADMVAGLVTTNEKSFWFDYNRGALGLNGETFSEMPANIREASPMSIWNVSQEIHTGRIFENIIGPFYILIVPLAGLCLLIVLISGVLVWWWVYRKK